MTVDVLWYVPNTVNRTVIQTPAVKDETVTIALITVCASVHNQTNQ
jgi:hypothetical protein